MGIKSLQKFETSDAMMATRARDIEAFATEPACAAIVDFLTRLFSLFGSIKYRNEMTLAGLKDATASYVDRLLEYFEVVGICIDWASPKCKQIEQGNRNAKSRARPLNATERAAVLEHGVLFPLERLRSSRDVYLHVRNELVNFLMTEYVPPRGTVYVMAHPDHPDRVQEIDEHGDRSAFTIACPMEGDGQVLSLTHALEMPTVVVGNDRDIAFMARLMWLTTPAFREQRFLLYRCDERLVNRIEGRSKYRPPEADTLPPAPSGAVEFCNFGQCDMVISVPKPPAKKKPAKKRSSVYEHPFADIGAQMRDTELAAPGAALHITWLAIMFGCDFVHRAHWIGGISADFVLNHWGDERWVWLDGEGPWTVRVDADALVAFLEENIARKPALRALAPGESEGSRRRPDEFMYAGTIARSTWTLLYMLNSPLHPLDVPDPLETVDGVSRWGWKQVAGRIRETNIVCV